MDVNFQGVGMGKLVGPAGGGGGTGPGGAGSGVSTQFRVLPNSKSSECKSVEADKVPFASHRGSLHLKLSMPVAPPHRTFSSDTMKLGDEYGGSSSTSPLADVSAGFRIGDSWKGQRPPTLAGVVSGSPPYLEFRELTGEDDLELAEGETLIALK